MTTIALYVNTRSNVLTVTSTIGALKARKGAKVLYSVSTERAPRELQKVLNTVSSLQKQFSKVGAVLDKSNVHRAHLSEKGINRQAASKIAQHFHNESVKALLAASTALVKYGF